MLHRAAAAGIKVLVADRLADLPVHVVAGGLRGQRQAGGAIGPSIADGPQLLVHAQAGHGNADAQRAKVSCRRRSSSSRKRIVAGGKRQQGDFVVAGVPIRFQGRGDNRFHPPETQGRFMVVLWQKRQRPGQPRMISRAMRSWTHSTSGTTARWAAARHPVPATTAGSMRRGMAGRTGWRRPAGRPEPSYADSYHRAHTRAAGRAAISARRLAPSPDGGLQLQPAVADLGQNLFAVADHEQIDEPAIGSGFGRAWAPGDHQRMVPGPLGGNQGNPTQVEDRQDVGAAEVVLEGQAEHVELRQRGKRLQAVQGQPMLAERLLHVPAGANARSQAQSSRRFITA